MKKYLISILLAAGLLSPIHSQDTPKWKDSVKIMNNINAIVGSNSLSRSSKINSIYNLLEKNKPTELLTKNSSSTKQRSKIKKSVSTVAGGQCQATTKKGSQCKRKASVGSKYCWQHGG